MEIDQRYLVPVEPELEEEEVATHQKRRSRLPNDSAVVISSNDVSDASNGVDSETRNGIEVTNGDHGSTDSVIATGFDFESPKNGVEQEINKLHENSVYFDQNDGTKSVDEVSEMENGFRLGNGAKDLEVESHIAVMNEGENVGNGFSDLTLTPLEDSLEEQTMKSKSFDNESGQVGDFDSIEEVEQEETEFDVEKVIEKQNTHDLYCPNCHSCITRRVILRRKQKILYPRRKTKTNKVESNANVQVHETVEIHPTDSPALATDNQNNSRDPEVFRCLACFSLFIPTGDGFKMFRLFGDRSPNENVQDLQKAPASNTNWFSSIFRTDKKKIIVEQDYLVTGNETEALQQSLLANTQSPSLVLINNKTETVSQKAREEIEVSSKENDEHSEKGSIHIGEKLGSATIKANADGAVPSFTSAAQGASSEYEGKLLSDSVVIHQETNATFSSSQVTTIHKEETTVIKKGPFIDLGNNNTGNDVILNVETSPLLDPAVSQTQILQGNDGSLIVSDMLQTGIRTCTNEGAGASLDILKSIVYGGLIESIASLGVVSSAAGAGSTTLNIVALGLANLIGGLFIIFHNLIELKNDTSSSNESEDRYEAALGRRGKFPLHATIAIISFLAFGMLAPVIYGFSFRKSDDKDLKLALVGGVSLLCIFLLATGKAYVRRPPKAYISTILYYVITGIMASGVSYVVGDLLNKLMEKLGWFDESGLAVPTIFPAGKPSQHEWVSY